MSLFNLFSLKKKKDSFKDPRDGKVYKIVNIGNQVWLAENLAFKPNKGNFWAYDNKKSNIKKYGYLYDWETAKNVCPTGWHIPSKGEYETLIEWYDDEFYEEDKIFKNLINKSDLSGFSVIFSGCRYNDGVFRAYDDETSFWTSTEANSKEAEVLNIYKELKTELLSTDEKICGLSVRCIKDN